MKYNILVVEDQQEISDIISKYLVKEGYDYSVAGDGFEALDYFNHQQFHLVLLDIMMPGIDGFEVLFTSKYITTPMIAIILIPINRCQGLLK